MRWLAAAVLLSTQLACEPVSVPQPALPTPVSQTCSRTLINSRDAHSRQAYLEERLTCVPELAKAVENGEIAGILYNPTDEELRTVLDPILADVYDPGQLSRMALDVYHNLKEYTAVTVLPATAEVYSAHTGLYIAVRPLFFDNPAILTEFDADGFLLHELFHIKDWFYGIRYDDLVIEQRHLTYGIINPEFFGALGEVRALHERLELNYIARIDGIKDNSEGYFDSNCSAYIEKWKLLHDSTSTEFERDVLNRQLLQLHIKPLFGPHNQIYFDIQGHQETRNVNMFD